MNAKGKTTVRVTETFERYENGELVERRQRVRGPDDEPLFEMPSAERYMAEIQDWLERMPEPKFHVRVPKGRR